MNYAFFFRIIRLLMCGFFLIGCAACNSGNKVVSLNYEKKSDRPQYSAREKDAKDTIPVQAGLYGAEDIGTFKILAYDLDEAWEIAPKEAAKAGADFFWINPESWAPYTKKKYVEDGKYTYWLGQKSDYLRTRVTQTTSHYEDIPVEGVYSYSCTIYRIAPTKEKQDSIREFGLNACLWNCANDVDEFFDCPSIYLGKYIDSGAKLDRWNIEEFFKCITNDPRGRDYGGWYQRNLDNDYEKLELLLNKALVDRDGYYAALKIVRGKKYNLEDLRKPDKPSVKHSLKEKLSIIYERKYIDDLKLHSDFLKKVEIALSEYKLPEPTNSIERIKAKVTKIQFFEGGSSMPKKNEIVYAKVFKSSDTRYIWWELNMECPPLERKELISLESVIRTVDGNVYLRQTRAWRIAPKNTWFWLATGWGAENTGTWKPGTYSVELYINGDYTAIAEFMVN